VFSEAHAHVVFFVYKVTNTNDVFLRRNVWEGIACLFKLRLFSTAWLHAAPQGILSSSFLRNAVMSGNYACLERIFISPSIYCAVRLFIFSISRKEAAFSWTTYTCVIHFFFPLP
jgi:hypothetical protein